MAAIMPTALDALPHVSESPNGKYVESPQQSLVEPPTLDRVASEQSNQELSDEYKLPKFGNLLVVIGGNVVHQLSFFIIISSASVYAEHLGGSATFSGLIIGVPTAISGMLLIPMANFDRGKYGIPMYFSYACLFLGSIFYALADRANFLYLILIGRMVTGAGYISFMYSKRYLTDPRLVGIRQRTTLASWLVVGQGVGLSLGPFLGGVLFKIGFPNEVFNGFTAPGWVMSVCYVGLTIASVFLFRDVPARPENAPIALRRVFRRKPPSSPATHNPESPIPQAPVDEFKLSWAQQGVLATMSWFAMLNFFILGGFEANIPVYTAVLFGYSPYNAGNFIALGGLVIFPVLLLNVRFSRFFQDRTTLAFGSSIALMGLLIMLALVRAERVTRAGYFVVWVLVALGCNLATTCTLSLLSKQLPGEWNGRTSMVIQYSNYTGRVTGAVWGGAGVSVGMMNFLGLQIAMVGIGLLMYLTLWKNLKTKTG